LAQAMMDAEVSAQIGAGHGERAPDTRTAQRNGYRDRPWDTRVGTVDLGDPQAAPRQLLPQLP
jgi:transposase-like protein